MFEFQCKTTNIISIYLFCIESDDDDHQTAMVDSCFVVQHIMCMAYLILFFDILSIFHFLKTCVYVFGKSFRHHQIYK